MEKLHGLAIKVTFKYLEGEEEHYRKDVYDKELIYTYESCSSIGKTSLCFCR